MNQNFRRAYHEALFQQMLFIDKHGILNNADKRHGASSLFAGRIAASIGVPCVQHTFLHVSPKNALNELPADT